MFEVFRPYDLKIGPCKPMCMKIDLIEAHSDHALAQCASIRANTVNVLLAVGKPPSCFSVLVRPVFGPEFGCGCDTLPGGPV